MTEGQEQFADIIYEELAARNTSLHDFARDIGVDHDALASMLAGKTILTREAADKIGSAWGLSDGFFSRLYLQCTGNAVS